MKTKRKLVIDLHIQSLECIFEWVKENNKNISKINSSMKKTMETEGYSEMGRKRV